MNNLMSRNLTFSQVDRHTSDNVSNLVCDHAFRDYPKCKTFFYYSF